MVKGDFQVVRFGERLFGEKFEWFTDDPKRQDVVIGHKKQLAVSQNIWGKPNSDLYPRWAAIVDGEDVDKISKMVQEGENLGVPKEVLKRARGICSGEWTGFIYRVLSGDSRIVTLQRMLELTDNHYRKLYLDTLPLIMQTSEHTAQLTTEMASEVQKKFYDGQINVLSCSTTFELGVDVGELETVFMRNVPPTAANYVQRAGRAGRRTSSTAFALTFAQRRSHDFTHFAEPLRIINGEIRPPHIEISNEKIIKRHMYAVALAMFWKQKPEYFGQVKAFFPQSGESASRVIKEFLQRKPEKLKASLKRIVPRAMWEKLGVEDWSWVDGLLHEQDGVLSKAEAQLISDLRELKAVEEEYKDAENYRRAEAIKRTINTLEKRYILNFLSQRNVIPKYGFPVDVVELQIYHHGEEAKGLELDRDLKVALSEYAPGSQVTDILCLRFPGYHDKREGFWESLLYGLLEGACNALEIERQDVDGTLYPYAGDPYSPALILFDDVPGGAGHVKRIAEEDSFMDTLHQTLEMVSNCECGGKEADTSCYGCLCNYTNQYCHDKLKRGYVLEFVSKML
ncbi:MAG: DUF1998 domain-containing protein [Firmicutes bacterium]|nr:DUF1998 domain-containing protein [Bacillota bacterium]